MASVVLQKYRKLESEIVNEKDCEIRNTRAFEAKFRNHNGREKKVEDDDEKDGEESITKKGVQQT